MEKAKGPLRFSSGKIKYSYCNCNFYTGCNNACEYCCVGNILKSSWKSRVLLLFKSKKEAIEKFKTQADSDIDNLRKYGIFFSLITDPLLPATKDLTYQAIDYCIKRDIPFKVLTKCADWGKDPFLKNYPEDKKHLGHFGFSITGEDQFEHGASSNMDRITLLKKLHNDGFKTWISAEPIINVESTIKMMKISKDYCHMVRFEILAPARYTNPKLSYLFKKRDLLNLYRWAERNMSDKLIYWGDNFLLHAGLKREETNSTETGDLILELNEEH